MPMPRDMRLLIVDDDAAALYAMTEAIKHSVESIVIDQATSAKQAFERLSEERYDCVISDVLMPEMDGIEFLSMSRQIYPKMAVILMTAGDPSIRDVALEKGAFAFFRKPLDIGKVIYELGRAAEWTRRER
jgi:two-component system, OmpR family, response regulator ResD